MAEYKEQMKSSVLSLTHLSTCYCYIRNVELHLSFETVSFLFQAFFFFFKHGLLFMFPLSNSLCIRSVILWWIYADQFYIQGNSSCSSKLSILLRSKGKNLFVEFNCAFQEVDVGFLYLCKKHTCLPTWCVCRNETQKSEKVPPLSPKLPSGIPMLWWFKPLL